MLSSITTLQVGGTATAISHASEHNCELDSHADTCVVGKHATVLYEHPRQVSIIGYDASQGSSEGLKVVDVAIAYDSPRNGMVHILRINQAVLVPTIEHNLLCPMQLRLNDVDVND